ncbi:anti-sigma factor RsiW [Kitasatospora sp. MAA4]|uniref:anti-sigma factor n=1 Tax=Kitasatospora sp. MAA4 TaxID=3035093 RepID=UPI0024760E93|nr:zf-HC2 domain-containing protein [Kitasatospora sp. MAA4]MDH6132312.1 anti-sigma factor RsiW [Kitasatospora sp. MAA4]
MNGQDREVPQGQDRHLDAGAYVLGVLDEADRIAFQAHLAHCAQCAAEVAELSELEPLLAELADTGVRESLPEPGPRLLEGLLGEVRSVRRRSRTRRLVLVAAAAVLVLGGPAVTAAVLDAGGHSTVQAGVLHTATDPTGTISATVGVAAKGWGSAVTLTLNGVSGPRDCDLVAVSTSGQQQTVTSWHIAPTGYSPQAPSQPQAGKELQTTGGAGFHPADISHFEVQDLATHQILVSIPAGG